MTFNDNLSNTPATDAYGGDGRSVPASIPLPELGVTPLLQQPWVSPVDSASQYALNIVPGRIKGRPTEFRRSVVLTMDAMGITLSGKAVPTGSAYIMYYLLFGLLITELAMRRQKSLPIPWGDVEAIRLDPSTQKGVVCYHLPGKPKALFSLGFKTADLATLNHFGQVARLFVPNKVEEGAVKGANAAVGIAVAVAIVLIIIVILAALTSHPH